MQDKRHLFVIAALKGLSRLSINKLRCLGKVVGSIIWFMQLRPARITRTNLQLCYREKTPEARKRLAKRSLQESVKTFLEMAVMWEWPICRVLGLIDRVEGENLIEQHQSQGRGVIILGPHLGNWELAGLYLASRYPMASLYRPPRMKALEDYMSGVRARTGAELVPTNNRGVARLLSLLRDGKVIGILPDQVPPPESAMYAPFFGLDASTMTLVSRLAAKTGARVVCAYALRLEGKKGFRLVIRAADEAVAAREPLTAVTALNRSVEVCIADAPEQYQWVYKRFRQRPEGHPRIYS